MSVLMLMMLQLPAVCSAPPDQGIREICRWMDLQERRREVALAVEGELARSRDTLEQERILEGTSGSMGLTGTTGAILALLTALEGLRYGLRKFHA